MKKLLTFLVLSVLLTGCSVGNKSSPSDTVVNTVDKLGRDAFVDLYTDSMSYQQGVYEFGDNCISYAFPIEWNMLINNDTIYLSEVTTDTCYEILTVSMEEYKEMVNNSTLIDDCFSASKTIYGSAFMDGLSLTKCSYVETGSPSEFFSTVQRLYSTITFNDYDYETPYNVYGKSVDNDTVIVVKAYKMFEEDFPLGKVFTTLSDLEDSYAKSSDNTKVQVDRYFERLQLDSDSLRESTAQLFRYIYFGSISDEEQANSRLGKLGIFPYYTEQQITVDELLNIRDAENTRVAVMRFGDNVLSNFGLDKFSEVSVFDDWVTWQPVDSVNRDILYTLQAFPIDDARNVESIILPWAHSYLYNVSSISVEDKAELYLNDSLSVHKEVIETYSISDTLGSATEYTVTYTCGDIVAKLPIVFYVIEYGDYCIELRSILSAEKYKATNLSVDEIMFNGIQVNNQVEDMFESYTNYHNTITNYSRGLLRLLYDGNILLLKGDE